MHKLGILNMAIGFLVIGLAAAAGAFIGWEINGASLEDPKMLNEWSLILKRSAHGHTNLFGMLHVLFGLTIPYSQLSEKIKKWQTIGLCCGTVAVSVGLYLQSIYGPSLKISLISVIEGFLLSMALVAVLSHSLGLMIKFKV